MIPELELQRARELALASHNASQLFWILLIGGAVIIVFWSLVRWMMRRSKIKKQRAAALAQEICVSIARSNAYRQQRRDDRRWNSVMDQIGWDEKARDTVPDPLPTKRTHSAA